MLDLTGFERMEAARLRADGLEQVAVELNFGCFECAAARLFWLEIWATRATLILSNFERAAVTARFGELVMVWRLESDDLE